MARASFLVALHLFGPCGRWFFFRSDAAVCLCACRLEVLPKPTLAGQAFRVPTRVSAASVFCNASALLLASSTPFRCELARLSQATFRVAWRCRHQTSRARCATLHMLSVLSVGLVQHKIIYEGKLWRQRTVEISTPGGSWGKQADRSDKIGARHIPKPAHLVVQGRLHYCVGAARNPTHHTSDGLPSTMPCCSWGSHG